MNKPKTNDPWPSYLRRASAVAGNFAPLELGDLPYEAALELGGDYTLKIGTTSKVHLGTFNLPAGITCAGMTEACFDLCYGLRSQLNMGVKTHTKNFLRLLWYEARRDLEGAAREFESLLRPRHTHRLHGVGDFFSQFYVNLITEVFRRNKKAVGFGYTRSFHLDMAGLASLPNFTLWASLDPFNLAEGYAWSKKMGAKRAYMTLELAEQSGDPWFQCPEQTEKRPDCASCGACFAREVKPKRTSVAFDIHSAPKVMLDYYRNLVQQLEAA